jgi:hypothetical protein
VLDVVLDVVFWWHRVDDFVLMTLCWCSQCKEVYTCHRPALPPLPCRRNQDAVVCWICLSVQVKRQSGNSLRATLVSKRLRQICVCCVQVNRHLETA